MPLDPVTNPYTPVAGQAPAVLGGRDDVLSGFDRLLARARTGRPVAHPLLVGLHGVGKTVLLHEFARRAATGGWVVVDHGTGLDDQLLPTLTRLVWRSLPRIAPPGAPAALALPDGTPEDRTGEAADLLVALGHLAREHGRGVALVLDDVHRAAPEFAAELAAALARLTQQHLPVVVVAAGLPQVGAGLPASGQAHALQVVDVDLLSDLDAARTLAETAAVEGVRFSRNALGAAVVPAGGCPFFLQVVGDQLWRQASGREITEVDVSRAVPAVVDALDRTFFGPRTQDLPPAQLRYLRAMAEDGAGEVTSGRIAAVLGLRSSSQTGQTREALIRKGLIYAPRLGRAAFTAPGLAAHLRRCAPLERHRLRPAPARSAPQVAPDRSADPPAADQRLVDLRDELARGLS